MNLAIIPGPTELWIILAVVLLLFAHRIPGMARSLGSGIVEFKKGLRSGDDDQLPPPKQSEERARAEVLRDDEPGSKKERQGANT